MPHRRQSQRGSALLIVFVFAAIIAIMLYREMPVAVFEAQRQKEQLLVDRGHEYVRAVQLFYRRNRGQYPSSFEQLESTNNIRYLRKRYKDPFTGKDDWRLLHAGPGGLLIDSKVQQQPVAGQNRQPAANGQQQPGSLGQSSSTGGFGQQNSNSASAFGNDSNSDATVVVSQVPQRPPAVPANSGPNAGGQTPSTQTLNQNPDAPLLPPSGSDSSQGNAAGGVNAGLTAPGGPSLNAPAGSGNSAQAPGVMQTLNPVLGNATTPQSSASGFGGAQSSGSGTGMGQMGGGGALAGVASKAKGHTIKVINDQVDYSLWEFYYNPATDTTGRTALGGTAPTTGQTGSPGFAPTTAGNSNSSFGSSSSSATSPTTTPDASTTNTTNNQGSTAPSTLPNYTPPQ